MALMVRSLCLHGNVTQSELTAQYANKITVKVDVVKLTALPDALMRNFCLTVKFSMY